MLGTLTSLTWTLTWPVVVAGTSLSSTAPPTAQVL
jgi:hypothetical protein